MLCVRFALMIFPFCLSVRAGIPARRPGNFLLSCQKKVTKEEALKHIWANICIEGSVGEERSGSNQACAKTLCEGRHNTERLCVGSRSLNDRTL